MAAGDTISGKDMTVKYGSGGANVANHAGKWQIKKEAVNSEFATNSTAGWFKGQTGAKKWSGSLHVKLHDGAALEFTVGSTVEMQFHQDASSYYSGSIVITEVNDGEVDAESGDPLSVDITFMGHGALTVGGGTIGAV